MIASAASSPSSARDLHDRFVTLLLPRLVTHASVKFRLHKCRARRDEAIQECLSLAWQWYVRLCRRGKDPIDFPVAFVGYVVRAVKSGRRLCGIERARDVLSPLAQQRQGFAVESLPSSTRTSMHDLYGKPQGQEMHDAFEERLQDNTVTPPPDAAAFRIDWPRFFAALKARDQDLAVFLSLGHSCTAAAAKFGLTPGRVTQLRQQWHRNWLAFESGKDPGDSAVSQERPVAA
jgi:hypothetical protein